MRVEKNFSNAFTLAEVLITLGIIGVVAAMTMPTLINQTNGAQYKAAYKKALSVISQAVTLNVALDDTGFAEATADSNDGTNVATADAATPSIASILRGRINVITAKVGAETGHTISGTDAAIADTNTTLYFNDGAAFSFPQNAANCKPDNQCKGIIDVNGVKGPNKLTTDAESPADVYPVRFYDQTIIPNSDAAREVLYK